MGYDVFEKNIIGIYGDKGRRWLGNLPQEIEHLEQLWGLTGLVPVDNLSYHYVLSGFQGEQPIILKLGLDRLSLDRESRALNAFQGYGAVSLLEKKENALLLQKAVPGRPLKQVYCDQGKKAIEVACKVVEKLHKAPQPSTNHFPNIYEWLAALDKEWILPGDHLQRARSLKNRLLDSRQPLVLLHGDLHQDNILSHGDDWLVIDPKGVLGFPINELRACVEDPLYDLPYISEYFNCRFDEVVQWYYVHLVLAACWQIEDNLDASLFLKLADSIVPLV